jgi:FkbM family methyltransferase
MFIPLDYLVYKYKINLKGVIHIGAHECEEISNYEKYLNRDKILWVEGLTHKVEECKQRYPGVLIENCVVSDKIENVKFNVSNNGQSSSFLEFGLHSTYHPYVYYTHSFQVETKTMNNILQNYKHIPFNFVNLDIQGTELKALKGMDQYLNQIDYVYTEVNSDYVYKDCNLINEIDDYLKSFNLERVETNFTDCKWGDAFYKKIN